MDAPRPTPWTLDEAVAICRLVEPIAEANSFHVALTGGTLYKDGSRKDLDLLFYSVRHTEWRVNRSQLLADLRAAGIKAYRDYGWVVKAAADLDTSGRVVDLFFPEVPHDERGPDAGGEHYGL